MTSTQEAMTLKICLSNGEWDNSPNAFVYLFAYFTVTVLAKKPWLGDV